MAATSPESEKKAKTDPKLRYAHMIVYLARRASLVTWCVGAGVFIGVTVFPVAAGMIDSWLTLMPILAVICAITLTIPPTEEWEYTPWQAEPERYEHYTRD